MRILSVHPRCIPDPVRDKWASICAIRVETTVQYGFIVVVPDFPSSIGVLRGRRQKALRRHAIILQLRKILDLVLVTTAYYCDLRSLYL